MKLYIVSEGTYNEEYSMRIFREKKNALDYCHALLQQSRFQNYAATRSDSDPLSWRWEKQFDWLRAVEQETED